MRTVKGDESVRRGRLRKALQFQLMAHEAVALADDPCEIADAVVILCVHAGIAASDALCLAALGEHPQGQDHREAIALLRTVDPRMGTHLQTLLGMKTRAAYGHDPMTIDQLRRAQRAMDALVESAQF